MRPPPPDEPIDETLSAQVIPAPPRSLATNEELEARTRSTVRPLARLLGCECAETGDCTCITEGAPASDP